MFCLWCVVYILHTLHSIHICYSTTFAQLLIQTLHLFHLPSSPPFSSGVIPFYFIFFCQFCVVEKLPNPHTQNHNIILLKFIAMQPLLMYAQLSLEFFFACSIHFLLFPKSDKIPPEWWNSACSKCSLIWNKSELISICILHVLSMINSIITILECLIFSLGQ